jgi:hypothetical protein
MSEARQYQDGSRILIFRRPDPECQLLEACYEGIRFNQVQLLFLPASAMRDDPFRDDLDVLFNVSGAPEHLLGHGFAAAGWFVTLPACGISHSCGTADFGRVWHIIRTRNGYRLQGARYCDSMTKLTAALSPMSLWPRISKDQSVSKQG